MTSAFPLPLSSPGQKIGLFGGSFNPVHEGHRLVALQCLKRLELDTVWMLVTPGNPLKDHSGLAPLPERARAVRDFLADPRVHVTAFEAEHGFRYTYQTIVFLTDTLPDRRFVWIMGADSFRDFDRWERWEDIAAQVPMAIYARPGTGRGVSASRAATKLRRFRIPEAESGRIALCEPPAWVFLTGVMSAQSSSAIRAARVAE